MNSQLILSKLKTLPQTISDYMTRTFFQSGRTGYVKLGFASLLAIWGLHFLGRTYGLLPKKSVKDVHIFITGAGSGIGRQMAILFARRGAKVSIVDINLEAAQAVEATLTQEGLQGKAIYCDVSDSQTVRQAAQTARSAFGEVEILINNAGIVSGKKILDNSEKMIEKTYQVNAISHAYTVREFLPEMLRRNKGHVVTIASIASTVGVCGLADYCASKFAAFGFDESLRMELQKLKSNVKTTCICPYYINTGMFEGVQSRFSFFFPILSEAYASKRIVNAILQEEKVTVLPAVYNISFLLRALLPTWMFDGVADLTGANSSMDHFVGRVKPQ